jgi:hypothetical protein
MPVPTMSNWLIVVDERTQLKWISFFEKKNQIVKPLCEQFNMVKQDFDNHVRYVCCDNAGENIAFKNRANSLV